MPAVSGQKQRRKAYVEATRDKTPAAPPEEKPFLASRQPTVDALPPRVSGPALDKIRSSMRFAERPIRETPERILRRDARRVPFLCQWI